MGKGKSKGKVSWPVAQLGAYLERHPEAAKGDALAIVKGEPPAPGSAAAALQALREERSPSPHRPAAQALAQVWSPKRMSSKKTGEGYKGVQETIEAVKGALIFTRVVFDESRQRPQELVLWFAGARLITQNQLISLLQKNIKAYFQYKKAWKEKMRLARHLIHTERACQFTDPVKIEVLRHGRRLVDRDGLPPQFKILIDELRYRTKESDHPAILLEDDPNMVIDVLPYQRAVRQSDRHTLGVGLRVVAHPGWKPPPAPDPLLDWLKRSET